MAIDTRDKRASCLGFDGPFRFVLPNPGGSVDADDRAQLAWKYSGIAIGGGGGVPADVLSPLFLVSAGRLLTR